MLQERNNSICKYNVPIIVSKQKLIINFDLRSLTYHFGEFGQYFWNVSSNGCEDIVVKKEPANIYLRKFFYS